MGYGSYDLPCRSYEGHVTVDHDQRAVTGVSYHLPRLEKLPTHDEIHHQEQPSFLAADSWTPWPVGRSTEKTPHKKNQKKGKNRFFFQIFGVYFIVYLGLNIS